MEGSRSRSSAAIVSRVRVSTIPGASPPRSAVPVCLWIECGFNRKASASTVHTNRATFEQIELPKLSDATNVQQQYAIRRWSFRFFYPSVFPGYSGFRPRKRPLVTVLYFVKWYRVHLDAHVHTCTYICTQSREHQVVVAFILPRKRMNVPLKACAIRFQSSFASAFYPRIYDKNAVRTAVISTICIKHWEIYLAYREVHLWRKYVKKCAHLITFCLIKM